MIQFVPKRMVQVSIFCLVIVLAVSLAAYPAWELVAPHYAPGPCDFPNEASRRLLTSSFCQTPVSDLAMPIVPRPQVDQKGQIKILLGFGVLFLGLYFLVEYAYEKKSFDESSPTLRC